mgnify:CR=1 FL=1
MKKELIIVIIIVIAIIILDTITHNYTKINFAKINEQLEQIKEISEDPLVRHFVSNNMNEWLEDSIDTEKLLVGPAYIVASDRKLVGFIRCAFLDTNGILNLHYGVHPDYRKMHYGTKILEETSEYLFRSDMPIKNI